MLVQNAQSIHVHVTGGLWKEHGVHSSHGTSSRLAYRGWLNHSTSSTAARRNRALPRMQRITRDAATMYCVGPAGAGLYCSTYPDMPCSCRLIPNDKLL